MNRTHSILKLWLSAALLAQGALPALAVSTVFVTNGLPLRVIYSPASSPWSTNTPGYLEQTGVNQYLFGAASVGQGDFRLHSRLSIILNATAASFSVNGNSNLGFDSGSGAIFIEGPAFGLTSTVTITAATNHIQSGVPFDFDVVRTGTNLSFWINNKQIHQRAFTASVFGQVGFRPWRSTMDLYHFSVEQALVLNVLQPTAGDMWFAPSGGIQFEVLSDAGVPANKIQLTLNGVDRSSALALSGSANSWTVQMATGVEANNRYQCQINVSDANGLSAAQSFAFGTFNQQTDLFIEGEDYNFSNGQFIDNPPLSSMPGPASYLDQPGTEGVDFHMMGKAKAVTSIYRIPDPVASAKTGDSLRQAYIDAKLIDPGVEDYHVGTFVDGEWLNYTRTLPANLYTVWLRAARTNILPFAARLDQVTAGANSAAQTLLPLGAFSGTQTSGAQVYDFFQLKDAFGNPIAVPLSGVTTLRLSLGGGAPGLSINYLLLAPSPSATQPPFVSGVTPASGAANIATAPLIKATILNGSTTVVPTSVRLSPERE